MIALLTILLFYQVTGYECTYVQFNNDATPWGTGPCNSSSECLCPPERAKPDCSYVRYKKSIPSGLSMGCVQLLFFKIYLDITRYILL